MERRISYLSCKFPAGVAGAFIIASPLVAAVNVAQHHNHSSRDGLYVDSAFTLRAAANLRRDTNFDGTISGNVYGQPLYIENGPSGKAMIITATESNNVYSLNAADGRILWQQHLGAPVPLARLSCGDIDPLGITSTPVVDLASRTLLLDAMTTPDSGASKRHLIFSLNVDTGAVNPGWPVSVDGTVLFGTNVFNSALQNQRGALAIVGNRVYVPYGGHFGDCGAYHGCLIGVPLNNPAGMQAWATPATGGGAWAVGGVASDGVDLFIATGNTFGVIVWSGGESIIRLQPGPVFSNQALDYWAPTNWLNLDNGDVDLGGSGALLVDLPGSAPSNLVVSLGKDGNAYLLNRSNLGGISAPSAQAHVSSTSIIQAAACYQTTQGTYVVYCGNNSHLSAFRILPGTPPTITNAWTAAQNGRGSPFVTSSDGIHDVVVWGIGSEGDQRLHGFDGDTGAAVFSGGGASELMTGTRRFNTGIAVQGRIYLANDNRVYAFTVPVAPLVLTSPTTLPDGSFHFSFTNFPGINFTIFGTTNVGLPLTQWSILGSAREFNSGQFDFTDPQATNLPAHFYRVRTP